MIFSPQSPQRMMFAKYSIKNFVIAESFLRDLRVFCGKIVILIYPKSDVSREVNAIILPLPKNIINYFGPVCNRLRRNMPGPSGWRLFFEAYRRCDHKPLTRIAIFRESHPHPERRPEPPRRLTRARLNHHRPWHFPAWLI